MDRLKQVPRDYRQHHVQFEVARGATERNGRVVTDDLRDNLAHGLGDDRVHLSGHDRGSWLEVGQADLPESRARTRRRPPQVVGNFVEGQCDHPQHTGRLDQSVPGRLGLEVVACLRQWQAGGRDQLLDDRRGKARRGVDAGAHSGATQRQLTDPRQRAVQALHAVADRGRVSAELLPEGHRRCIHQVRAPGLHDLGELDALALQRRGQMGKRGDEVVDDRLRRGDMDRGGEHVIGRLRGVDVVVGVHRPAEPLGGERRQHLVGVHVG